MGAIERKAGEVVIEDIQVDLLEAGLVVTVEAALAEALLVRIFVAAGAGLLGLEEGECAALVLVVVAVLALGLRVRAAQQEARLRVVELFRIRPRPADQAHVGTEVLDVTARAAVAAKGGAVQARAAASVCCDVFVTVETARLGHLRTGRVALLTLAIAREVRMCLTEWARRQQLCMRRQRGTQPDGERDPQR